MLNNKVEKIATIYIISIIYQNKDKNKLQTILILILKSIFLIFAFATL